jgi:hypothetical protein
MAAEPGNRAATGYHRNADTRPPDMDATPLVAGNGNAGFEVHIEFVVIDGPEGVRLQELQAAAVQRVLRALHKARTATKGESR